MSRAAILMTAIVIGRALAPSPIARAQEIKGREVKGLVHFTFDDGPDHATTPPILDLLDEHGLRATFFVVGRRLSGKSTNARANREVLARIVAAGHRVGNHTFDHVNLEVTPLDEGLADVDKNARVIERETGAKPSLFRPPFGRLTGDVRRKLARRGYTIVTWSIDGKDFTSTVDEIRERVVADILAKEGGVVLLHDTKARTAAALKLILDDLETANCARIAAGKTPIVPAELDHWLGADVPEEVAARTEAMRERIRTGCQAVDKEGTED